MESTNARVSSYLVNGLLYFLESSHNTYVAYAHELETLQSDIAQMYHRIEKTRYNHISQGYNEMIHLQSMLRRRRILKSELWNLKHVIDQIQPERLVTKMRNIQATIEHSIQGTEQYMGEQAEAWSEYFRNDYLVHVRNFQLRVLGEPIIFDKSAEKITVIADWFSDKKNPMKMSLEEARDEVEEGNAIQIDENTIKLIKKRKSVRIQVLERDQYCYRLCGNPGYSVIRTVPKEKGTPLRMEDAICVCPHCASQKIG